MGPISVDHQLQTVFFVAMIINIPGSQVFYHISFCFHPTIAMPVTQHLIGLLVDRNRILCYQCLVKLFYRSCQLYFIRLCNNYQTKKQQQYRKKLFQFYYCGLSILTIQLNPYLSVSIPKRCAQNVSWTGINTLPPSAKPLNAFSNLSTES